MKLLPIKEPEATSSSHQATIFSILKNYDDGLSWLANNYIQLFCLKNLYLANETRKGTLDYYYNEYGDWSLFELSSNPLLQYSLLDYQFLNELIKNKNIDIAKLLMDAIDNNQYIYMGIDKFYINYYNQYNKCHSGHHLFINGYNLSQKYFITHDNFKGGKYCERNISFETIKAAFYSLLGNQLLQEEAYVGGIAFIKYKVRNWHQKLPNMFSTNLSKIILSIKEYLMYPELCARFNNNYNYTFGIECYKELENLILIDGFTLHTEVDFRAFCCMRDHKKIMVFRFKHIELKYHCLLTYYIQHMEEIEHELSLIIMLIIKYNINHKQNTLYKAITKLNNVKQKELQLLNQFVKEMEATNGICNNSML